MFLIQLRYVFKDNPLAEVIKLQHDKLSKVSTEHISAIIEGETKSKVLLLMDGYDEYRPGTNREIDTAIDKTIGNCFLLLTSRPGYVRQPVKDKMDGEVTIEGFSTENVKKCASFYLESEELSGQMLQQVKESGIDELLRVPIILLMACQLFYEKRHLPKTKTEVVGSIFELSMDRTTLKENNFGLKSTEIENLHSILFVLGKFSWKALKKNVQQLLLNKVSDISTRKYCSVRTRSYCGVLVLLKLCGAPDFVEFVFGRFSYFYIAIAYSNFTFCCT